MRTHPSFSPAVLSLAAPALLLLALLAGCSHMPRMLGGPGDVVLVVDGEQQHETALPRGRTLTLDMRDPGQSGYVFAGTSFNPELMRLDGILKQPDGRVRYVFTALAAGESDIQIKIKKAEPGYRPDVFKQVHVVVQ